ncbi:MAG: PAS domain-containing protein [Trueperaceae bacterium]|nr:PAS domain-containing protein [Trueperaceae bacterium]
MSRVVFAGLVALGASLLAGGLEPLLGAATHTLVALVVVLVAALFGTVYGAVALITAAVAAFAALLAPPSLLQVVPFVTLHGYDALLVELLALGAVVAVVGRLQHQLSEARAYSQRREMLLQNLVDAMPAPVAAFDDDNRYLVANRALAKTLGLEPSDMIGRSHDEVGGFRTYLSPDVKQTLRSERQEADKVYSILDFPIRDGAGRPQARGVMAFDITEQRQQELRLRDSEARNRALLDAIPDAIVRHDARGHYLEIVPPKTFRLVDTLPNLVRADGTKTGIDDVLPEDVARGFREHLQRVLAIGGIQTHEYVVMVDGTPSYREARTVAVNESETVSIVRDFTAQKKQELRLRDSEARNRALLDAMPDGMACYDREGRYLDVRVPSDLEPIYPANELIGRRLSDVGPPNIVRGFMKRLEHVFTTGERQTYRYTLTQNGKTRHREARTVKINDNEALSIVRDITEQTEQQRALRDSEARNRALLEAIPDTIVVFDKDLRISEVRAPKSYTLLRDITSILGKCPEELTDAVMAQRFRETHQRVLAQGGVGHVQEKVAVEGKTVYRDHRITKIDDNETLALVRDITERTERERALRDSEARNRALLEAIPDGIVVFGSDCRMLEVRAPKDFVPINTPDRLVGRYQHELSDEATARAVEAAVRNVLQQGGVERVEEGKLSVEGVTVYRDYRITAVNEHTALALIRDITDQKCYEQSLIEADKNKSRFLAMMSHELRTPLTSVIGFAEILLDRFPGPLNDQQAEYVTYIHDSGHHLLSLLNDVLDLSKIEAGGLELSLELLYPTELARSVLAILKEKAHKNGLTLRTDFPEQCAPLRADARKLKQMLFNYLSNAAKFTPPAGTITLRIEETPDEVRFEVCDTGLGIAPEDQDKLFKAFSQIENSEQHRHPGTGLGLSLVEKFAELHGGRVWVESTVGAGSTFGFSVARNLGHETN